MSTSVNKNTLNNRIAIGGVGGSGTRVVTEIIINAGFYIGSDIAQNTKDNFWWTVLLKRPLWYKHLLDKNQLDKVLEAIDVFYHLMQGKTLSSHNLNLIDDCIADRKHRETDHIESEWLHARKTKMLQNEDVEWEKYVGWGWKEPNTHIFVEDLYNHDPNLKYIHVIRHGLDMAFSKNQNQLRNWGYLVDVIAPPENPKDPIASLDYWIRINRRSIDLAQNLFKSNFLLIHYDRLCTNPQSEVKRILDFIGTNTDSQPLVEIVNPPKSLGRYLEHDMNIFRTDQLQAVQELGFTL